MDKKIIIKKLKDEVENLKLHIENLELVMFNLEDENEDASN